MNSQELDCGTALPDGVPHGATSQARPWKTNAMAAGAAAVLAVAVYGFPGDWSALWGGSTAVSEHVLDSGVYAADDVDRLYANIERHLRWQPSDVRAWVLKARLDMRAQRYQQAAAAYEKALAGTSKAARDADVWAEYAEARGMAQGRTLAGEPLKLVHKALAIDGNHPRALDMAGSAAWEARDFAQAARYWKQLLQQFPPGSAQHTGLARAIERAEQRAKLSLPPTPAALPAN
jgi:cytochrome c-type biogenesis protein CcmH